MAALADILPSTPINKNLQTPKVKSLRPIDDQSDELRKRIEGRGGEQSLNLTGAGVSSGQVFKRTLGGEGNTRAKRVTTKTTSGNRRIGTTL